MSLNRMKYDQQLSILHLEFAWEISPSWYVCKESAPGNQHADIGAMYISQTSLQHGLKQHITESVTMTSEGYR